MNWWQIGLSTAMGSGLVTLLVFLLASSQRASGLAAEAMKSMKGGISMQEKLRQAMWQQSEALDAWEDWGRRMKRVWDDTPGLPKMPAPPSAHPDLSKIFNDNDE
jgi:hypothetical protein